VGGRRRPVLAAHDVQRDTRSLRREGIACLGLWMHYQVVGAAPFGSPQLAK
jgi:hypothetical protein